MILWDLHEFPQAQRMYRKERPKECVRECVSNTTVFKTWLYYWDELCNSAHYLSQQKIEAQSPSPKERKCGVKTENQSAPSSLSNLEALAVVASAATYEGCRSYRRSWTLICCSLCCWGGCWNTVAKSSSPPPSSPEKWLGVLKKDMWVLFVETEGFWVSQMGLSQPTSKVTCYMSVSFWWVRLCLSVFLCCLLLWFLAFGLFVVVFLVYCLFSAAYLGQYCYIQLDPAYVG